MQEDINEKLYYPEEKIDFLIKHLKLNVKDIADLFGVQSNYISKLRNQEHNTLKPLHLYAFTGAFNIGRKINRTTTRAMLDLSHYKFKLLLKWYTKKYGKHIVDCNESYTSKTRS